MQSLANLGGEYEVEERVHPLGIVVTQDCDLVWDFQARQSGDPKQQNKQLPNVLLCELWEAERLRGKQAIASDIWKRIRQNQDERYHYLQDCSVTNDLLGNGFPTLAIDFKRVFSIPTEELYFRIQSGQTRRRSVLTIPFLQDLSNRFAYYHLRVALPDPPKITAALLPAATTPSEAGPVDPSSSTPS
ncbi:MAG: hypothetical protein ABL967_00225 [Bryobacteraceae bacterium]